MKSLVSLSSLATFLWLGVIAVVMASSCLAQDSPRNATNAVLRLNLKPQWNRSGQVDGIRVSYELAAFSRGKVLRSLYNSTRCSQPFGERAIK